MAVDSAVAGIAQEGKYLSFILGKKEYGLEILKVHEIDGMTGLAPVSGTPGYVRGVINLRGRVIPVICLREYFKLPPVQETEKTCIIVVQVQNGDEQVTLGLVVDEVSEVLNISRRQIEPVASFGGGMEEGDFITGLGQLEDRAVILLDIDALWNHEEMEQILESAP